MHGFVRSNIDFWLYMFGGTVEIQEYTFLAWFVRTECEAERFYIHPHLLHQEWLPPRPQTQGPVPQAVHGPCHSKWVCPVFGCITCSLIHLCDIRVFAAHTFDCVSRPKITHYQCMGEPFLKPRARFHMLPLQQCSTSTRGGSSSRPRTCWREKPKLIQKWSR